MNRQTLVRYLLIFLTFLILGVGTVVALILSRGNTITDQGISSTGTIRLTVSPSTDIQVFLDEQKKTLSSLNTLDSIVPGEYELKVIHDGYSAWQQRISVRAGLVTTVSVQLFPEDLRSEQLSKTNISSLFFASSRRYVYYSVVSSQIGGNIGIWRQPLVQSNIPLIEERSVKITNLTNLIHEQVSESEFKIIPSLDDAKVLLLVSGKYYLLDADRYNEPNADNELNFSYNLNSIDWLEGSSKLILRSGSLLFDYDIAKKTATLITYQPETDLKYVAIAGTVMFVQGNQLYKYTGGTITKVTLENIQLPEKISAIYAGTIALDNLVLKSEDGNLYFLSIPESYVQKLGKYELISVSPSGRDLITKAGDKYTSFEITISAARNVVETVPHETKLTTDIKAGSIIWDVNSNFFVYQTDGAKKELNSADKWGSNILSLIDLTQNPNTKFTVLADNSSIVIKLFDGGNAGDAADTQANLYKLKLSN